MRKDGILQFAIQSNGRLTESSLQYIRSRGMRFEVRERSLMSSCENFPLEILYLRSADIPEYISRGVADFGIVGENVLLEKGSRVRILKKLGFAKCSLVIGVPKNWRLKKLSDLEGERIATSYPNLLSMFLRRRGINAAIIPIQGSVEIAPKLDLADAICDLTQTGMTLRKNNLVPIATILQSEAVLIANSVTAQAQYNFLNLCKFSLPIKTR